MRKFRTADGVERSFMIDGEHIKFANGMYVAESEAIVKLIKKIPADYPIADHYGKIINSKQEDKHETKKTNPTPTPASD